MAKFSLKRRSEIQRANRGGKRRLFGRIVYCLAVVSMLSYLIVFPPWVGSLYLPGSGFDYWDVLPGQGDAPMSFEFNGTFGLQDSEINAPIWSPPHPHSPDYEASFRWPWQAANAYSHVELSMFGLAWRIAIGMALLGLVLKAWTSLVSSNHRDRFVDLVWSTTLGTAISMLGLVVFGLFTAGYGLTDPVVVGGLSAGAVLGLAYGAITFQAERANHSLLTVTQLAWFAVGLVIATIILVVCVFLANLLRGEVIGVTELGTAGYAGDQTLINVLCGIGIVVCGWTVSWISGSYKFPRGFVVGVFVGALVLGLASAMAF